MSNKKKHPEAWAFYVEHARNMEGTEFEYLGKYRVPVPDMRTPVEFIYADDPGPLWGKYIERWYRDDLKSPSVRGKIQFIVNNF
jgi:hypothetical protein